MLQTRATFTWPTLRVGHEKVAWVRSIARTRAKQKAGYFYVAHPVYGNCFSTYIFEQFKKCIKLFC